MSAKRPKESTVLLIDVGVANSVLEKIKFVARKLIEKKIFLSQSHEIAILTMPPEHANQNEEIVGFQIPTWELIDKLLLLKATDRLRTWIRGLVNTIKFIQENAYYPSKSAKTRPVRKIVMMSDFKNDVDVGSTNLGNLVESLNDENVQLLIIGEDDLRNAAEESLLPSQNFLKKLASKVSGFYMTFNEIELDLRYYKCPPSKSVPAYQTLELGDIKIPVVAFVKVSDTQKFDSWKRSKDGKDVITVKQYLDRGRAEYQDDERTTGYRYGGQFFAVPPENLDSMKYISGPKSYQIFAFTKIVNVGLEFWDSASTRIVFPVKKKSEKEFYSLAQAMKNRDLVAIVRKVHYANATPRMVALFPYINVPEEPWGMIEITLPFAEDRRIMDAKPVKSIVKQLTKEQRDAVDGFLDALLLDESDSQMDESQSFLPGSISNPTLQHKWHMLSHRARYPNEPLPPMEDYLKEVFENPLIKEKCKTPVEVIKRVFNIDEVIPTKKRFSKNEEGAPERKLTASDVSELGETSAKMEESTGDNSDNEIAEDLKIDMSDVNIEDIDMI